MLRRSEEAAYTIIETTDIGGTNVTSGWLSMVDFDRAQALVEIGTWDSGDDLDECRFEQATSSGGAGAKELTSDASGGDYDTDNPVDADGDQVFLEVRAEDLDVDGGFTHIRLFLGEGGNTGADNVTAVISRDRSTYPKDQLHRAAATGVMVYVTKA